MYASYAECSSLTKATVGTTKGRAATAAIAAYVRQLVKRDKSPQPTLSSAVAKVIGQSAADRETCATVFGVTRVLGAFEHVILVMTPRGACVAGCVITRRTRYNNSKSETPGDMKRVLYKSEEALRLLVAAATALYASIGVDLTASCDPKDKSEARAYAEHFKKSAHRKAWIAEPPYAAPPYATAVTKFSGIKASDTPVPTNMMA